MAGMFNVWAMMNNQNDKMHFDGNKKKLLMGG
jgi:hypothetical protein